MSLVHVVDPETLLQCPYDPAHRVKAGRFTRHIVKCGKNHPELKLVSCPFNNQHRIKEEERSHHLATCPDRVCVERDFYTSEVCSGNLTVPPYENKVESTEDWDCDSATGFTYDPTAHMNSLKFVNPSALSYMKPSEKRAFRKQLQTRGFGDDNVNDDEDCAVQIVPLVQQLHIKSSVQSQRPIPGSAGTSSPSAVQKPPATISKPSAAISKPCDPVSSLERDKHMRAQQVNENSLLHIGKGKGRGLRCERGVK